MRIYSGPTGINSWLREFLVYPMPILVVNPLSGPPFHGITFGYIFMINFENDREFREN